MLAKNRSFVNQYAIGWPNRIVSYRENLYAGHVRAKFLEPRRRLHARCQLVAWSGVGHCNRRNGASATSLALAACHLPPRTSTNTVHAFPVRTATELESAPQSAYEDRERLYPPLSKSYLGIHRAYNRRISQRILLRQDTVILQAGHHEVEL
jgi:hypothetical protein